MTQGVFPYTFQPSYAEEDFILCPANRRVYDLIMGWGEAPRSALIVGEEGSGKTHLLHIWQQRLQAQVYDLRETGWLNWRSQWRGAPLALDNLEGVVGAEEAFFHFLNAALQQKVSLFMTMESSSVLMRFELPDLQSRLRLIPQFTIHPADDEQLEALYAKQFQDMQMQISPQVLESLLRYAPRSYRGVKEMSRLCVSYVARSKKDLRPEVIKALCFEVAP